MRIVLREWGSGIKHRVLCRRRTELFIYRRCAGEVESSPVCVSVALCRRRWTELLTRVRCADEGEIITRVRCDDERGNIIYRLRCCDEGEIITRVRCDGERGNIIYRVRCADEGEKITQPYPLYRRRGGSWPTQGPCADEAERPDAERRA